MKFPGPAAHLDSTIRSDDHSCANQAASTDAACSAKLSPGWVLEAPQGEQPGRPTDAHVMPNALTCDLEGQHDSGLSGRTIGDKPKETAMPPSTGATPRPPQAPTVVDSCSLLLPGWVPGAPPKREQPEQCDTTDAHRPCITSCTSMPSASSTDPHSFTVTSASGSASSLLGLTHASKRTCQHEIELLSSTAAGHLHQREHNLEASYRPAKMCKSETGTILDSMLLLSEPDIDEASRPCMVHQQATSSRPTLSLALTRYWPSLAVLRLRPYLPRMRLPAICLPFMCCTNLCLPCLRLPAMCLGIMC